MASSAPKWLKKEPIKLFTPTPHSLENTIVLKALGALGQKDQDALRASIQSAWAGDLGKRGAFALIACPLPTQRFATIRTLIPIIAEYFVEPQKVRYLLEGGCCVCKKEHGTGF